MPDDGELTLRPQREGKLSLWSAPITSPTPPPYSPILPPFSSWAVRKLEPIFFSPRVLEFAGFLCIEPQFNWNYCIQPTSKTVYYFYSLCGEYLSSGGNILLNFPKAQDDDADGFDTMVVKEDDNDSEVRSLFLNNYSLKEG